MSHLNLTEEQYLDRRSKFEEHKATLTKEPSGDNVKKEYSVGCFQESDWPHRGSSTREPNALKKAFHCKLTSSSV